MSKRHRNHTMSAAIQMKNQNDHRSTSPKSLVMASTASLLPYRVVGRLDRAPRAKHVRCTWPDSGGHGASMCVWQRLHREVLVTRRRLCHAAGGSGDTVTTARKNCHVRVSTALSNRPTVGTAITTTVLAFLLTSCGGDGSVDRPSPTASITASLPSPTARPSVTRSPLR